MASRTLATSLLVLGFALVPAAAAGPQRRFVDARLDAEPRRRRLLLRPSNEACSLTRGSRWRSGAV